MIKAFVRQKSISQSHVYSNSNKREGSAKNFFLKIFQVIGVRFIWSVAIIFFLIYGIFFLFRYTLFVPDYVIKNIEYLASSVSKFDDPYLYKAIKSKIYDENFYIVKRSRKSVLNSIQGQFPIVQDLTIRYKTKNTVVVGVEFFPLDMVVKNQNLKFGVYNDYVFTIYSGNTIGNGVVVLNMPEYMSGVDTIEGLFFKQGTHELQSQLDLIDKGFPDAKQISYLPGGEKTVVILPGNKTVYINNMSDIAQQIKNFEFLKKYYPEYNSLREIDLGSLEKDKVIVKR